MSLIDRNGLKAESWRRIADAQNAATAQALIPFSDLEDALAARISNQPLGVEIANTVKLAALEPHLDQLGLIAIGFPAFSDGRGFSIARQLRKAGFTGILRAVGPLIVDQFAYALACGFDEVEVPEASMARQPVAQWVAALDQISATYQRGYVAGGNILEQRRAARAGDGT
jgi:uncharacterized protein (DUF934 family)